MNYVKNNVHLSYFAKFEDYVETFESDLYVIILVVPALFVLASFADEI